jgi:hypothetical protein
MPPGRVGDGAGRSVWSPKNGKIVNQKLLSKSPNPLAGLANKIGAHRAYVANNIIERQRPATISVPRSRCSPSSR